MRWNNKQYFLSVKADITFSQLYSIEKILDAVFYRKCINKSKFGALAFKLLRKICCYLILVSECVFHILSWFFKVNKIRKYENLSFIFLNQGRRLIFDNTNIVAQTVSWDYALHVIFNLYYVDGQYLVSKKGRCELYLNRSYCLFKCCLTNIWSLDKILSKG